MELGWGYKGFLPLAALGRGTQDGVGFILMPALRTRRCSFRVGRNFDWGIRDGVDLDRGTGDGVVRNWGGIFRVGSQSCISLGVGRLCQQGRLPVAVIINPQLFRFPPTVAESKPRMLLFHGVAEVVLQFEPDVPPVAELLLRILRPECVKPESMNVLGDLGLGIQ